MRPIAVPAIAAMMLAGAAMAGPPASPPSPRIFLSPSGEPYRAGPQTPDPLRAWFDRVDTKRQGYIDREEFRADALRFFKVLDENGDGMIDGFEAADYEHKIAPELAAEAEGRFPAQTERSAGPEGGQGGGQGGGGQSPGGEHRHRGGFGRPDGGQAQGADAQHAGGKRQAPRRAIGQLIDEPEPVTGADFNLDSHITLAEWMQATDQRFALLDTDKTGRLTYAALKAKLDGPAAPARR